MTTPGQGPLLIPGPEPPLTSVAALACVRPLYSQPLRVLRGCCFGVTWGETGAGEARPQGWGSALQSQTSAVSPLRGTVAQLESPCSHSDG